jgi:WD40 repeat protein/energy-coupling factor transporter ATP-binding protein EcfA2
MVFSGYDDMKLERSLFHTRIVPLLQDFCREHRAELIVDDLRAGLSAEQWKSPHLFDFALRQIHDAYNSGTSPFFLVMTGEKYGWTPLPVSLPEHEFFELQAFWEPEERASVLQWYRCDHNALPPAYVLQPFPDDFSRQQTLETSAELLRIFRRGVRQAGWPDDEGRREKFFASALEQECGHAFFRPPGWEPVEITRERVVSVHRIVENWPEDDDHALEYLDWDEQDLDINSAAMGAQKNFARQLRQFYGERAEDHLLQLKATWSLPEGQRVGGSLSFDEDAFVEELLKRLQGILRPQLESLPAIELLAQERETQKTLTSQLSANFEGQKECLASLLQRCKSPAGRVLTLLGPDGAGKTTLLSKLTHVLREQHPEFVVISRFLGSTPLSSRLSTLLESVLDELKQAYSTPLTMPAGQKERREAFASFLHLASKEQPLVVILDGLEALLDASQFQPSDWLPPSLPPHVQVIVSAPSPWKRQLAFCETASIPPLGASAAHRLLTQWLEEHQRTLQSEQRDELLQQFTNLQQSPLALKLGAMVARHWTSFDADWKQEPVFSLQTLAERWFSLLSERFGTAQMQLVWGLWLSSRSGLSEEEWWHAVQDSTEELNSPALDPVDWKHFLNTLKPWLSAQSWQGITLLRLNSDPLKRWARQRFLSGDYTHRYSALLASYFHKRAIQSEEYGWSEDPRILSELPWLLKESGQWEALESLLTDFDFLMTKCRMGLLEELQDDYQSTWEIVQRRDSSTLQEWEQFFREQHSVLRRGDQRWPTHRILLQLATEYADRSPITKAAEAWLKRGSCDWFWLKRIRRVRERSRKLSLGQLTELDSAIKTLKPLSDSLVLVLAEHDNTLRTLDLDRREWVHNLVHEQIVDDCTLHPDGRLLASWGQEHRELSIWDANTGQLQRSLKGHKESIAGALWLQERLLLSWSEDATLRLWDVDSKQDPIVFRGHSGGVLGAQLLQNGSLLTWAEDTTLRLWNVQTGANLGIFMGHPSPVTHVEPLNGGCWLSWSATEDSTDPTLYLWDSQLPFPEQTLSGHTHAPDKSLRLGSRLLTWYQTQPERSGGDRLLCWDLETSQLQWQWDAHTGGVAGAQHWPEQEALFVWSPQGHLHLLNLSDGQERWCRQEDAAISGVFAVDGQRWLTWSEEPVLKLWHDDPPEVAMLLQAHRRSVKGTFVHGPYCFSWDQSGECQFWKLPRHKGRDLLSQLDGHQDEITALSKLSANELLSASRDGSLRLWNVSNGETIARYDGHSKAVLGVYAHSEERFVSWAEDHTLRLWDRNKVGPVARFEGHTAALTQVEALDNGVLVSASEDGTLRLSNPRKPDEEHILAGHLGPVRGFRELDGRSLVSWSDDCTLRLWDPTRSQLTKTLGIGQKGQLRGIVGLKDGRFLTWSNNPVMHLWHPERAGSSIRLEGHESAVLGALELSDGVLCSWAEFETEIRLWNPRTGVAEGVLSGHTASILGVKELPTGRLVSWSEDGSLRLWDPLWKKCVATLEGHKGIVRGALAMGFEHILSWSEDKSIRVWSAQSGRCERILPVALCPTEVVLRGDNDWLLYWPERSVFARLNGETGKLLQTYKGHRGPIRGVMPLEDGRVLSWSEDTMLTVWDADSGVAEVWLQEHNDRVNGAMQLSTNRILSWSDDTTLRVWDLRMAHCLLILQEHLDPVVQVQSLSGKRFLSCGEGEENTLHLWDARTLDHIRAVPLGHSRPPAGLLPLTDDTFLTWEQHGSLLRRWNWKTGLQLNVYKGHTSWVEGATQLRNGELLSWGVDGTLRHWDTDTGECLQLLQGHFSSLEGLWELGRHQLLTWNQSQFHRWSLDSGKLLETLTEPEVYNKRFAWLMAREFSLEAQATTMGFLSMSREKTYGLLPSQLVWKEEWLTWWNAPSQATHHRLFPNGILVAQLSRGQLAFLQLHHGSIPLTLEAFEASLKERLRS